MFTFNIEISSRNLVWSFVPSYSVYLPPSILHDAFPMSRWRAHIFKGDIHHQATWKQTECRQVYPNPEFADRSRLTRPISPPKDSSPPLSHNQRFKVGLECTRFFPSVFLHLMHIPAAINHSALSHIENFSLSSLAPCIDSIWRSGHHSNRMVRRKLSSRRCPEFINFVLQIPRAWWQGSCTC